MVRPALRSRSLRKIRTKLPGGTVIMHYFRRRPASAKCSECGGVLHGTVRERNLKAKKIPKTKKRPERPYGGVMCSACTRKTMKAKLPK